VERRLPPDAVGERVHQLHERDRVPVQHPNQAPSPAAAHHDQQAPRSQGQDRGPQGKGPQESKPHPDKGEQQGGERNK
jgi:hypothetical protein